jgi:microcystin degradation protein MlrC
MEPFALHGIDAGKRKIIALKGANHFRAGFAGLVQDIITVDSTGLSTANITWFPRHHLKSTLWPSHEGVVWDAFQGCR